MQAVFVLCHSLRGFVRGAMPKQPFACLPAALQQKPSSAKAAAPKASELTSIGSAPAAPRQCLELPAPTTKALQFDWGCTHWACVAVATHEEPKASYNFDWALGGFGHWWLPGSDASAQRLRIVQISWAYGKFDFGKPPGPPTLYTTELVQPCGFALSTAVADKHGLSKEKLLTRGRPLRDVLWEMLRDVRRVVENGGRVCLHNVEHEASVVHAELRRLGMDADFWAQTVASPGCLCLMDPVLAHWLRNRRGDPLKSKAVGFRFLAQVLLGERAVNQMKPGQLRWLVLEKIHRRVHKYKQSSGLQETGDAAAKRGPATEAPAEAAIPAKRARFS